MQINERETIMNWNRRINNITLGILLCVAARAMGQAPTGGQAHPSAGHSATKWPLIINRRPIMPTPSQVAAEREKNRLGDEAASALDAGHYEEAEDYAQQSMAIGQVGGVALETLAAALDAEGKTKEALAAYQKISDEGDVYPRNLIPYALLLLKAGHWAEAVAAYNKQLPYLSDGQLMAANSHFSADVPQPKELETALHIALGLTCSYEATWGGHSQSAKALSEYKKAIALEPNSALGNLYYGRALRQAHRIAEAKAAFKKAAALGNDNVKAAAQKEIW